MHTVEQTTKVQPHYLIATCTFCSKSDPGLKLWCQKNKQNKIMFVCINSFALRQWGFLSPSYSQTLGCQVWSPNPPDTHTNTIKTQAPAAGV